MPKNFSQIAAAPPENIKVASVWITLKPLLNLKREALHAAPHVGVACRDPDPDAAWDRNHRRPRNVAAIKSALADALMLTRAPPGRSTTMAGAN